MENCCDQDNQGELEYRVVLDHGVFAEGFRPEEICFAENTTKQSPGKSEEDEDKIVDWVVVDSVLRFEENELPSPGRIQSFQNHCCGERTEEGSPEDLSWEVCTDFLR